MRRIAVLFVLTGVVVAGCGGPSQEQKDAAARERARATKLKTAAEEAAVVAVTCRQQVGGLLRALRSTESRLNVGMSFSDYGEQVGDISIGYDNMPIPRMDIDCVGGPGVAGERAFNSYRDAYNTWNSCIADYDCDTDSIDPELQRHWAKASRQTASARSSLVALETEAAEAQEAYEQQRKKAKEAEEALE